MLFNYSKIIVCFFFVTNIFAQQDCSNRQIDSLLNAIKYCKVSDSIYGVLNRLYKSSLRNDYAIGKAACLIRIGIHKGERGDFKEAFKTIQEAKTIAKQIENDSLLLFSDIALSVQYGRTGLNVKSIEIIDRSLSNIDKIHDFKRKEYFLGVLYTYKAVFSGGLQRQPSMEEYLSYHRKALYHFERIKEIIHIPAYTNIGEHYNAITAYDSAKYYYKKALNNGKATKRSLEIEYANLANIYYKTNDYNLSISYLDSSTAISKNKRIYYILEENYILYKKIYNQLGDIEKHLESADLALAYKDSTILRETKSIRDSVNYVLHYTEREGESALRKKTIVLINSILLILVLVAILFFQLCKRRKLKRLASETIKEVKSKSKEIVELRQKMVSSYEQVIEMAKANDPLFVNCFKELYPDFYDKLIHVQPSLTLMEIKVCFYMKLKFTTKEISHYTFVSVKAIQNRKNRLRKRLSIKKGGNIYEFLDSLE
ncbi:hypothetical protein OOZ15_19550 [Galbibacter sp. EGI 63066]|uniref:hypothetical protein n=1 Tax=Galbibacter sp. EGI 63066 TaxID=2993559 RepID=UPI002248DDCF|nr:hypothetical protein [Galbibacter sp. EGI 63066]MCX2682151.1 hypothetical protein [Galbibacter sp. EGI 63066]